MQSTASKEFAKHKEQENWYNKISGSKEPSWYANIEEPIKFETNK